jgi:hypothetical protein
MPRVNLREDSLKKLKPTEVPKPAFIKGDGFEGTLPFLPAQVVLSESEKRQLRAVGWKDGDPIPNLSAVVANALEAERSAVQNEKEEIPPGIERLKKKSEIISIDDLPEEGKERIKNILRKATEQVSRPPAARRQAAADENVNTAIPGLLDALKAAQKAVDPVAEDAVVKPRAKKTNTPPPDTEEKETAADSAVVVPPPRCSHCGFPTDKVDTATPSREDKLDFVAAILSQKRFTKSYTLLGGALTVEFRSLTTNENDLVVKQLVADWNKSRISGPAHSIQQALNYQQALSLLSVKTQAGPVKLEELSEYDVDAPVDETVIPEVIEYVTKVAMPTESIRKIINRAYISFQELVSKLEVMAEDSDFWQATEG